MKQLFVTSILFIQIISFGQNKKFILLDESSEMPIEYCNILIIGKDNGTYSDSKGYVKISAKENDSLLISHVLYKEIKLPLTSIKDTVWLSQKNQFLDEVIISSNKDFKEWSKERKEKHQWYIQPKTEFCVLLGKNKSLDTISKVRFPIEYLTQIKSKKIERAVFRLNIYSNSNGSINQKLNTENIIYTLEDNSEYITFDLKNPLLIPLEGLFLGIEFIGFENSSNSILENERNNFIKLSFASTKKSSTFYSNKFINNGKWSLLKKNNSVFPFELKSGLSLIFVYK